MNKRVYFISDLHLGANCLTDKRGAEVRAAAFLRSIKDDAGDLYLMGDVLDYWYEYRTVAPRGYLRFFGALAMLADAGVRLHWYIGNHDIWLFDYLRDEIGMEVVDGWREERILGKTFFLTHGDAVGRRSASFRFIRGLFRSRVAQKMYAAIHPRWTIPFAHAWSSGSRSSKPLMHPWQGLDAEPQALFASDYLRSHPYIDYFVMGHRHVAIDEPIGTARLIILGEWFSSPTYAVFDGESMRLEKWAGQDK